MNNKGVEIVDGIASLLRRTEDDYDLLEEKRYDNDRKYNIIINFMMDYGWEEGWSSITAYFPATIKRLILNELVNYSKHLANNQSFATKNNGLEKLDRDNVFALILECVQYCHNKGRELCFEFNVLVNTLKLLGSKQMVEAIIRSASSNYYTSIVRIPEEPSLSLSSGYEILFDKLFSEKHDEKQEKEHHFLRIINDFEEAKGRVKIEYIFSRKYYRQEEEEEGSRFSKLDSYTLKSHQTYLQLDRFDAQICESCLWNAQMQLIMDFCIPNVELVEGLDTLGSCEEKADYPSGEDYSSEAVKSSNIVEDGENQDSENCVVNEGKFVEFMISKGKGVADLDSIVTLLRSTEDKYDLLKEKRYDNNTKFMIIQYFMNNNDGLGKGGDNTIEAYFPATIKTLILNEVIHYCRHVTQSAHFAHGFHKLDQDTIFALISECIRYCYKAFFLKGRELSLEFDMLVNTLKILGSKRMVEANVGITSKDYASIVTIPEDPSGYQTLFDTLLSVNEPRKTEKCIRPIKDPEEIKKKQAEQEYFRRELYDSEQGSGFLKMYSRRLKHLPVNPRRYMKCRVMLDLKNVEFCQSCPEKILVQLFKDFITVMYPEIENWDFIEGAGAMLKSCPNPEPGVGLDILGSCVEKADYSSGEDSHEAVKSGTLVEDEGNQGTKNCVVNEGASSWLKPCSMSQKQDDGFAYTGKV